jgi:hypothetical protein
LLLPNDGFDDNQLRENEDKTIIAYDINKLLIKWSGTKNLDSKGKDIYEFIKNDRKCDDEGLHYGLIVLFEILL